MKKLIIVILISLLSTPCFADMGMQHSRNKSGGARGNFNDRMNNYRHSVSEMRSGINERMNHIRQNQRERRQDRRERMGSTIQRNRSRSTFGGQSSNYRRNRR